MLSKIDVLKLHRKRVRVLCRRLGVPGQISRSIGFRYRNAIQEGCIADRKSVV